MTEREMEDVERLQRRMREHAPAFRSLLCDIPGDFHVTIEERTQRQASLYDYKPVAVLEAYALRHDVLSEPAFQFLGDLLSLLEGKEGSRCRTAYVTIRKSLSRGEVLDENPDRLLDRLVDIVRGFHPVVNFVNLDRP